MIKIRISDQGSGLEDQGSGFEDQDQDQDQDQMNVMSRTLPE